MEVEEIQTSEQPATKYSRVNSDGGRGVLSNQTPSGSSLEVNAHPRGGGGPNSIMTATTPPQALGGNISRFGRQWQHSSRIIRVSRASGGKDRHSKVLTAKGPRDRRVRLSVSTAIQFYDLQDRLGYDQPSKAVEWLIKAAAEAINELPSLNSSSFPPESPQQISDEFRSGNVVDSGDVEQLEAEPTNFSQEHRGSGGLNQTGAMSKSGCSSNNSETSKGSGLSLSRSEIRVKARERARERTAKEKERDGEPGSRIDDAIHQYQQQHDVSSMSQHGSSFTQLLTAGINNLNENVALKSSGSPPPHHGIEGGNNGSSTLQWLSSNCTTTPMADYFGTGLIGLSASSRNTSLPQVMTLSPFNLGGSENHHSPHHHHQQQHAIHLQQHFPFLSDQHLLQVPNHNSNHSHNQAAGTCSSDGSEYNLSFSMSSSSTTSGLAAGFNRGTLQSNSNTSPSLLSYLQRFSATDGSSVPFFLGGSAISPAVDSHQDHNHFNPTGLQLYYGDGGRHSDQKGKGKN